MFAVSLLFRSPDQRAVDYDTVVAGQVHDARLDDEAAEFDQMPRASAALNLPASNVMPRLRRLMPVALRPVAAQCRQCRGQAAGVDRRDRL